MPGPRGLARRSAEARCAGPRGVVAHQRRKGVRPRRIDRDAGQRNGAGEGPQIPRNHANCAWRDGISEREAAPIIKVGPSLFRSGCRLRLNSQKVGSFEKGDRGARILKIQTLLQGNPRGLTTGEIARRTGVNPRTTYRDVRALEAMNVPIYEHQGRILIDPNYFIAPVKFTLREAMALLMGVRLMHRHTDEADPDVADAFTKLAAVMPAPVAEYVHATVRQMAERAPNPLYSRVLQTIALSWAGQRTVRIWYPSTDHQAKPRVIEPYFLEPSLIGHSSYVVARDRGLGEMRTFKLVRITRAEPMSDTYQIPASFDINEYLAGAWGIFHSGEPVEVRLRFYPPAAARVKESIWHPSQRLDDGPKGAVDMTVTVTGTVEITPWILGWGDAVEILAPRELREKIAAAGAKMAQRNSAVAEPLTKRRLGVASRKRDTVSPP
ncbi:MAG: transcriptional regulator [Chloroflexi bacterium]|nr:MAG: transcriptional regulator [Chloroflexota bacterium]TMD84074.1 MAG: transcriptional regulator [Chloroflexota bacterium]